MDAVAAYLQEYAAGLRPAPRGYWDWVNAGLPVPTPFSKHWIEQCAAVRLGSSQANNVPALPLPLLPAPSDKTLEYWNFLVSRDKHFRKHGYPDWEKRHGECTVWKVLLGRQIVMGHYTRNSKFDRNAIPVELSIDRDHLIVRHGQTDNERGNRMFDRLKRCAERQTAKAVQTPKVIYAPGATAPIVVDEFITGQPVEYHTWEGTNENYRQVWRPATVEKLGAKRVRINFKGELRWVEKRNLRPATGCECCGQSPVLRLLEAESKQLCRQCFERIAVEQLLFDVTPFEVSQLAVV